MTLYDRRISVPSRILLLAGAALALATPGCGSSSGGGGTGGTSGTGGRTGTGGSGPNLDARPDTVAPSPDFQASTGGAVGAPDAGMDQAVPATGGAGGNPGLDAGVDVPVSGAEAGSDVAQDRAMPDGQISDAPIGVDGGQGLDGNQIETGTPETAPVSCQSPTLSRSYTLPSLGTIAWAKDNTLATAGTFYPANPSFGSLTFTGTHKNQGSADMFVAGIDPKTGDGTWLFTAGDDNDQFASQVATSGNAVVGVVGTYTGTMEILAGSPITNPALTPVDYIAGIDGAVGAGLWSTSVNLGPKGGLKAIAGHRSQNFFVVCGAATNSAAQLGVKGATPGGGMDVAVAAINAIDGTVIWAKLFGGAGDQSCNAAAIDDDGNVLLTGQYVGTLDFGTGALTPPNGTTVGNLWVAKLNGATGAAIAAQAFDTSGLVASETIAVDAQGNVFVAGYFTPKFNFGVGTTLTALGTDSFVMKLSSSLAPVWARRWGGAGNLATSSGIAVDSNGNPTVVGFFSGKVDVGPGNTVLTANAPAIAAQDILIASLDGATGATTCAHNYGSLASNSTQNASAVAVNRWTTGASKNGVAIVGIYWGVLDFGPPTTALSAGTATSQAGYLLELQP